MEALSAQPQLVDRVYAALIEAMCEGTLPSGAHIVQDDLAKTFGTSRQPVQQALLLLKRQGFLTETGRRGLMVAPLEPDFIHSLYQIRGALDSLACREAARNRSPRLESGPALIAAGRAAMASGSVTQLIAADMDFHRFLYEVSGNPIIADIMSLNWHHVRRIMGAALQDTHGQSPPWDEHEVILKAVMAGDVEAAGGLAAAHADRAACALVARLTAS